MILSFYFERVKNNPAFSFLNLASHTKGRKFKFTLKRRVKWLSAVDKNNLRWFFKKSDSFYGIVMKWIIKKSLKTQN